MKELKVSSNRFDRRNFLKNSSMVGLGLAGAGVISSELKGAKVEAASVSATDIAVLQFALNLEYLEAEFYSYAVTGKSLEDNGIDITGAIGTQGPTTGGMKVPFDQLNAVGPVKKIAEQLMRDEVDHVLLLRSALGPENTIAKPAINLEAIVAMNSLAGFLTLARDFEVTGVSAYGGAVTLINKAILQTAAQIALTEALHSGNLQLLVDLNKIQIQPLDALDVIPPPAGVNFFDNSFNQALAVIRTTSEVLAIAYGNATVGTSKGGFFPNGFNGAITTIEKS